MDRTSKAYFARQAENWDQIAAGYFGEGVRQAAIAHAYLTADMEAADIGAGSGYISAGIAGLVNHLHVVDGSPEMLAAAQNGLAGFENLEFHLAEAEQLPFADQSLDVVFANMLLHHLTEPLAALKEFTRVLRPGGRVVITDMDTHPYADLKEEMADVWQGFDRSQIESWLREAGLVNRIVTCSGENCKSQANGSGQTVEISVFVASATRPMTVRSQVQNRYAILAEEPRSCCCSPKSDAGYFIANYQPQQLSAVPAEAAEISLGCGNPTAFAALQPGERVLDIGSGGGLDVFIAAQNVGPAGFVYGVDMTPAMLERARAAAQRNQISNVEFRQGVAEALPLEDNSVDVVISNCVINLSEDKGQVFNEAFRVLRSGGRLEVSDTVMSGGISPRLRADRAGWSECVNGALPQSEYLDLIRQAGFTQVNVQRSQRSDPFANVEVFSAQVSARKP